MSDIVNVYYWEATYRDQSGDLVSLNGEFEADGWSSAKYGAEREAYRASCRSPEAIRDSIEVTDLRLVRVDPRVANIPF